MLTLYRRLNFWPGQSSLPPSCMVTLLPVLASSSTDHTELRANPC